jgi:hypothetical protein
MMKGRNMKIKSKGGVVLSLSKSAIFALVWLVTLVIVAVLVTKLGSDVAASVVDLSVKASPISVIYIAFDK